TGYVAGLLHRHEQLERRSVREVPAHAPHRGEGAPTALGIPNRIITDSAKEDVERATTRLGGAVGVGAEPVLDRLTIPLNETACAEGIAPSRAGGPTPDLCPGVTPRDKYQCRRDDGLRYAHPQEGAPLQIDGPNLRAVLGTRSQNQIRRSQTTFAGGDISVGRRVLVVVENQIERHGGGAKHSEEVGDLATVIRRMIHAMPHRRAELLVESLTARENDRNDTACVGVGRCVEQLALLAPEIVPLLAERGDG